MQERKQDNWFELDQVKYKLDQTTSERKYCAVLVLYGTKVQFCLFGLWSRLFMRLASMSRSFSTSIPISIIRHTVCTNNWLTCEVQNFQFLVHQYLQAFAAVNFGWLEQLIFKASVTLKSKIYIQLRHYLHSGLGNNQLNQTGCLAHQTLSQSIPMILEGNDFYSILHVYKL